MFEFNVLAWTSRRVFWPEPRVELTSYCSAFRMYRAMSRQECTRVDATVPVEQLNSLGATNDSAIAVSNRYRCTKPLLIL